MLNYKLTIEIEKEFYENKIEIYDVSFDTIMSSLKTFVKNLVKTENIKIIFFDKKEYYNDYNFYFIFADNIHIGKIKQEIIK